MRPSRAYIGIIFIIVLGACFSRALGPSVAAAEFLMWDDLNIKANELARHGDYAGAIDAAERSLEMATKEYGPYDKNVVVCLNTLASIYRAQGNLTAAERFLRKSLAVRALVIGRDDINKDYLDIYNSLKDLADVCMAQKKYGEAASVYLRAVDLEEKALGPGSTGLLKDYKTLALLYGLQGKPADQEPFYKKAIAIEMAHADEDIGLVDTMGALAGLYIAQERYDEAEALLRKIIEKQESLEGASHASLAKYLNSLSLICIRKDELEEAETLARRALEIDERVLPAFHPDLAKDLSNLATVCAYRDNYKEAESLYKRSLDIAEESFGRSSEVMRTILTNMLNMYERGGNAAKAAGVRKQIKEWGALKEPAEEKGRNENKQGRADRRGGAGGTGRGWWGKSR